MRYSLGLDFGTLSARAVLLELPSGREVSTVEIPYDHGVITGFLGEVALPRDAALQDPADYEAVLWPLISRALEQGGVSPQDIVGVGVDFTSSTILPLNEEGVPLALLSEFRCRPHAWVKLWKHHGAQKEAEEMTLSARRRREPWLERMGGRVFLEGMLPKIFETLREDEEVYHRTARFAEAGDYVVRLLTGENCTSVSNAGFKALWEEKGGYPSREYLSSLDPRLEGLEEKLCSRVLMQTEVAGFVTEEASRRCGLAVGTPVMPSIVDAHAALPAMGVCESGEMVLICGTSGCHILLGDREVAIPGSCGCVKNALISGLWTYEAGQSSVGDTFDWWIRNAVPASLAREAEARGESLHEALSRLADPLPPGANGHLVLDWWNGNRVPYGNGDLSGVILGLTLSSTPQEIYRALLESIAYGTRRILEDYENASLSVDRITVTGGIAEKNPLFMQILADVTGRSLRLATTSQGGAYGSAVIAAVNFDGFGSVAEAYRTLSRGNGALVVPGEEHHREYEELYSEYCRLCDWFAREKPEHLLFLREKKQTAL